jgi:hypothetical protein
MISKGIDDEFTFLAFVKLEGHVEFLVLGVTDDT